MPYRRPSIFFVSLLALAQALVTFASRAGGLSYRFSNQDDVTATRVIASSAIRIFASETGGQQIGSGVVDDQEGLIFTAAHVVSRLDQGAWAAFPDAEQRHRLKKNAEAAGSSSSHY